MSEGQWEGCLRSEIYTPEMVNIMDVMQPDFSAPSGESLRQVEFRMVQFLNGMVLKLPEKLRTEYVMSLHQNENKGFACHNLQVTTHSTQDQDGLMLPPPHWDLLHKQRQSPSKKKSGKSRLQFVTTTGDPEVEDEISPREPNNLDQLHDMNVRSSSNPSFSIGIFTHAMPIKCLLTGLLGCSPTMASKICIDDSSMTVLQHSIKTGWQIKTMNDTAHLRLL
nr:TPA_asm: hypothetical protein HUJ06_009289 [Nelumbo nucifera]